MLQRKLYFWVGEAGGRTFNLHQAASAAHVKMVNFILKQ